MTANQTVRCARLGSERDRLVPRDGIDQGLFWRCRKRVIGGTRSEDLCIDVRHPPPFDTCVRIRSVTT